MGELAVDVPLRGTGCKDLAIYPGELVRFRLATREPLCQDCGGWPR
jgi:hypothetical protein